MLPLHEYTPRHPAYSGSRCGCAEDRSCRWCDGQAGDEYAIDRLSPADLADFNRQMTAFRARMDGAPTQPEENAA